MTLNPATNTFYRAIGGTPNNPNDCRTNAPIPGGTNTDFNYGVNGFGPPPGQSNEFTGPFSATYRNLATIPAPADVIGIADSRFSSPAIISAALGPWDLQGVAGQVHGQRHTGARTSSDSTAAFNCTFMDGHSKFVNLVKSVARPGNLWTVSPND